MKFYLITLLTLFTSVCKAQSTNEIFVHTENCNQFIAGINNYFSVFDKDNSNIKLENITALLFPIHGETKDTTGIKLDIIEKYGKFRINPNNYGYVTLNIELKDTTLTTFVKIKPKVIECRLGGRYKKGKIQAAYFKVQTGIIAHVNCCGFDARCTTLDFEIIRAPLNGTREKVFNSGGSFTAEAKTLLKKAKPSDIYIFKSIYYSCITKEKREAPDMIFEIE